MSRTTTEALVVMGLLLLAGGVIALHYLRADVPAEVVGIATTIIGGLLGYLRGREDGRRQDGGNDA